jgi:GTP-binding protein
MSGERDPYQDYLAINEELKAYNAFLEQRPQIVVASMMDMEGAEDRKKEFDKKLGFESIALSSLTHEGVDKLLKKAIELIESTPEFPIKGVNEATKMKVYDAREIEGKSDYQILRGENGWIIKGEKVERDAALINTTTDEGIVRLIRYLDNIGIEERLQEVGAQDGDKVQIGDFVFDYTT